MNKLSKEQGKQYLEELLGRNLEISGALIATADGIVFSQVNLMETAARLGAMAAAALGLGKQMVATSSSGELEEMTVAGANGYIFIYSISTTAVMITTSKPNANIAMAHWEARKTIAQFAGIKIK